MFQGPYFFFVSGVVILSNSTTGNFNSHRKNCWKTTWKSLANQNSQLTNSLPSPSSFGDFGHFHADFFQEKTPRIPCHILFCFCFSRKLSFKLLVTRILGKYHLLRYLYQRLNSQEIPRTNRGNPFPS